MKIVFYWLSFLFIVLFIVLLFVRIFTQEDNLNRKINNISIESPQDIFIDNIYASKSHHNETIKEEVGKVEEVKQKDKLKDLEQLFDNIDPYADDIEQITQDMFLDQIGTTKTSKKKALLNKQKPKLVIIIDDIMHMSHVRKINNIDLKITPSFIPEGNHIAKLAKYFNSYMIHLPLEATNYKHKTQMIIKTDDSYQTIERNIAYAVELLPKAKYLNNHTGGKFTANKESMKKLFKALDKFNLKFLDSKTTHKSIAHKVSKNKILIRDIFLDDAKSQYSITHQLKKAVKVAKMKGVAIAIGHPRAKTLNAIKDYASVLNQEVDVVYVDDL